MVGAVLFRMVESMTEVILELLADCKVTVIKPIILLVGISVLFAVINIRGIADEKAEASYEAKQINQYSCVSTEEGYEITFYSRTNKIFFSECYPREPAIRQVTDNIFEVSISVGSPATYIFYVDTENAELSETFFNPVFFGKGCVAYMQDGQLVLRDIFNKNLYMTISRDFTRTANPMSAIISIEMQDGGDVVLSYYKGENYEENSEIITIKRRTLK